MYNAIETYNYNSKRSQALTLDMLDNKWLNDSQI